MFNRTLFNPTVSLDNLGISNNVSFSIKRGSTFTPIGKNNKAVSIRQQKQLYTEYSIQIPLLKPSEYEALKTAVETLKGGVFAFPWNDFSDNYVIPWLFQNVEQYGTILKIAGSTNQYRPVKVYRAGQQLGIKPIYFFPPDAEVEVSDADPGGSLNRNTGIITSGTDISGESFACDCYYTPVRFKTLPTYTHAHTRGADFGLNSSIPIVNDGNSFQEFSCSFTLEEVCFNEVLEQAIIPTDTVASNITSLYLYSYVRGFELTPEFNQTEWSQKGLTIRQNNSPIIPTRTLKIPSNLVKHKDLIYFSTLFRAVGGGSFTINEV